jgi:hypothetical protein
MNTKNRPTCVVVIGRVWIVLSILICLSAALNLIATASPDRPIAVVQMALSIVAFTSAFMFLKLREWARRLLEYLTWISLTFVIGFSIFWLTKWVSTSLEKGSAGFTVVGAIMGLTSLALCGIPMSILLKFLRSKIVRDAMLKSIVAH